METFKFLKTEDKAEGILSIQLDCPPANAVHRDMYIEITEVFRSIADRAEVRAVILSARGKHFCAGNDLDEFGTLTPENGAERMWRVREAFFSIAECAVPVIGAVHGAALGTGLALAASCDFVVAAHDSRFGLPELTVGVMGGARHLARIAPQPVVRRMYFTGDPVSAQEFAAMGGAVFVCEGEALIETAMQFARRISQHSPTSVRVSKRILDRIEWTDLRTGYELEQNGTVRISAHPDAKEALRAFAERRGPQFADLSTDKSWFGV